MQHGIACCPSKRPHLPSSWATCWISRQINAIEQRTRWRLGLSCFIKCQASVRQALQLQRLLGCPVRHMLCTYAGCDAGRVILCVLVSSENP